MLPLVTVTSSKRETMAESGDYPEETEECSRCGATHAIYALDPDGVCIDCLLHPKSKQAKESKARSGRRRSNM